MLDKDNVDVLLGEIFDRVSSTSSSLLVTAAAGSGDKFIDLLDLFYSNNDKDGLSEQNTTVLSSVLVPVDSDQDSASNNTLTVWLPLANNLEAEQVQLSLVNISRESCILLQPFVLLPSSAKALCSILLAVRHYCTILRI